MHRSMVLMLERMRQHWKLEGWSLLDKLEILIDQEHSLARVDSSPLLPALRHKSILLDVLLPWILLPWCWNGSSWFVLLLVVGGVFLRWAKNVRLPFAGRVVHKMCV